jgi:hypothetical protein
MIPSFGYFEDRGAAGDHRLHRLHQNNTRSNRSALAHRGFNLGAIICFGRCPLWVKSGKAHTEQMLSAFTPLATFERTCRDVCLVPTPTPDIPASGILRSSRNRPGRRIDP